MFDFGLMGETLELLSAWLCTWVLVGVPVVLVAIGVKLEFEKSGGIGVVDLLATKLTLPVSFWVKMPDRREEESESSSGIGGSDSVELSWDDDCVG